MASTVKETKAKIERHSRVKRTVHQLLITAFVSVYPLLVAVEDWDALPALLPTIGFVAFGAIVTDVYNRVKPAK
jgi:hypothetical protein